MRGGVLPPAMLFAALAFALAFAPRRALLAALPVAAVAALLVLAVVRNLDFAKPLTETLFIGCWASVIGTAATVHLRGGIGPRFALLPALNAGLWAGATVAISGDRLDLVKAMLALLLAFPAHWLVTLRGGIAVKVVASWLVAVAILAAALATVPTPGYVPDHME